MKAFDYTVSTTAFAAQNLAMLFPSSTSYIIPANGYYQIGAVGAGGSGAAIFTTTTGGAATGGNGGGFCEKELYLTKGTVVTIAIGEGGASAVSSVSGTGANGTDGGDTTVIATGLSLIAYGGKGGKFTTTNAATATTDANVTPIGGDINFAGGKAGDATHTTNASNATGGGAAGSPYGVGGGSGTSTGTGNAGTGGGAVGGFASGNASGTGAALTAGAGTGGASADQVNAGNSLAGANKLGQSATRNSADGFLRIGSSTTSIGIGFDSLTDPFRALTGGGGNAGTAQTAGPGAGSGAYTIAQPAGVLGGTGGSSHNNLSTSGSGLIGGGSGGAASTGATATSGVGGKGFVVIKRIG